MLRHRWLRVVFFSRIVLVAIGCATSVGADGILDNLKKKFFGETPDQRLARCYELYSTGNCQEAIDCYLEAADAGDTEAYYSLGLIYSNGLIYESSDNCPGDPDEAFKWLTRAVDANVIGAYEELGICYAKGIGVETDLRRAIGLYKTHLNATLGQEFDSGVKALGETGIDALDELHVENYQNAELLLSRLLKANPKSFAVTGALFRTQMAAAMEYMIGATDVWSEEWETMPAIKYVSPREEEFKYLDDILMRMVQALGRSRATLDMLRQQMVDSEAKDANHVAFSQCQRLYDDYHEVGRQLVGEWCKYHIQAADKLRSEADGLIRNDRQKVENALRCLAPIVPLTVFAGQEKRTEFVRAFSNLKQLVREDEWPGLLSRAGIDPTTLGQ